MIRMELFKYKKYEKKSISVLEAELEKYYYLLGKRFKIDKTGIFTVVSVSISGNQIAIGFGGLSFIFVDELLNNDKCTEITTETLMEEKSVDGLSNKPPIGIMPKYIWESKRRNELGDAINRYLEAALPVPSEWIEEYNELIKNSVDSAEERHLLANEKFMSKELLEVLAEGHTLGILKNGLIHVER